MPCSYENDYMIFGTREKLVLRALSGDSRASLSSISKTIGCSYVTTGKIIERLKKELDIKFVLELDMTKLGLLQRHIIAIRFSKKPSVEWLESILKDDKNVQIAYLTRGQFDLVIFAAEKDPVKYIYWETLLMEKLSDYGATMKASDIPYLGFGYVPLDSTFIDSPELDMKDDDKKLLQLLNENSRMSYTELARRLKTNESTIRYRAFNLVKSGIIKRFTIAVQKPPQQYIIGFFENCTYTKTFEQKAALDRGHMMNIDKDLPLLTTFQMSAPLTGSYQNFVIALFNNRKEAIDNTVRKHKTIYRPEFYEEKHAWIMRPLKGIFLFRNLDIKENYNVVKWE